MAGSLLILDFLRQVLRHHLNIVLVLSKILAMVSRAGVKRLRLSILKSEWWFLMIRFIPREKMLVESALMIITLKLNYIIIWSSFQSCLEKNLIPLNWWWWWLTLFVCQIGNGSNIKRHGIILVPDHHQQSNWTENHNFWLRSSPCFFLASLISLFACLRTFYSQASDNHSQ